MSFNKKAGPLGRPLLFLQIPVDYIVRLAGRLEKEGCDKEDNKDDEENLGDASRGRSNAAKSQHRGNNR